MFDLLICIRCNDNIDFVIDTYQAAVKYTSPETSLITFAIDGNSHQVFKDRMLKIWGPDLVYISKQACGWGAGLYTLLVESYIYFNNKHSFNHFQSIDYDTLFIDAEVDEAILNEIDSPDIGLLGKYRSNNAHWKAVYEKNQVKFEKTFGSPGPNYIPGEGVQGGCMVMTRTLLTEMGKKGMFGSPFIDAKKYTAVADDHLLPIFTRMCDLKIKRLPSFAECHWRAKRDPRDAVKEGVKIFHPTKIKPDNKSRSTEIEIRNHFRQIRNEVDLLI